MSFRTDPRTARIRSATLEACQRLIDTQYAQTFRKAVEIIYTEFKRNHRPTGFNLTNFPSFYAAVNRWKKHPDHDLPDLSDDEAAFA